MADVYGQGTSGDFYSPGGGMPPPPPLPDRQGHDIVKAYMTSPLSKAIVAISAAISCSLISSLVTNMIFGKSPMFVPLVGFVCCGIGCFLPGTFGDLSRALGVFLILLLRRASLGAFFMQLVRQMQSAVSLSVRKPFPPGENPWRYKPSPGTTEPNFNMTFTLLAVILAGASLGWSVTKPIPLFPSWLGAIGTAGVCGYFATLRDGRGDFFRFIGWSLSEGLSELSVAAREVGLTDKGGVVFANALAYGSKLDGKYKIIEKCSSVFGLFLGAVSSTVAKVRSDMEEERGGEVGAGEKGRRRGKRDDRENDYEMPSPPPMPTQQGGWGAAPPAYSNDYSR